MKMENIPAGTMIHNIEIVPGAGGKIARGAGTSAKVLGVEGEFVHLEMPSSEIRKAPITGFASIGSLSNPEHRFIKLGKAGRKRHMGRRLPSLMLTPSSSALVTTYTLALPACPPPSAMLKLSLPSSLIRLAAVTQTPASSSSPLNRPRQPVSARPFSS